MSGKKFDLEPEKSLTFDQDDFFNRRGFAQTLSSLVTNSEEPLVVALDESWGSGKTQFLLKFNNLLMESGVPTIYFNAFENDLTPDAFEAIAAAIYENLEGFEEHEVSHGFLKNAGRVSRVVGRSVLNIGLKAATAGAVDAVDAGAAVDAAINAAGGEASNLFESAIAARAKLKGDLQGLHGSLERIRNLMQPAESNHPLVFVVDELDRCRPDFAIEILECLKHVFNHSSTRFVLGVDLNILAGSVEAAYGNGIDGKYYLSRFIDYRVTFPMQRHEPTKAELERYARHLWNQSEVFSEHEDIRDGICGVFADVVSEQEGSLRDIARLMSNLHLCLAVVAKNFFRVPPILAGLIALKHFDANLFDQAKAGTLTYSDIENFFKILDSESAPRSKKWMKHWWSAVLSDNPSEQDLEVTRSTMFRFNFLDQSDIVPSIALNIVEAFWQKG